MKSKINRLKHTYNTQWYNITICNIKCIEKAVVYRRKCYHQESTGCKVCILIKF